MAVEHEHELSMLDQTQEANKW